MANSTTAEHAVIRRDISKFKWTMMQVKQHKVAYLMIAPFFILFFIFTVVPVLLSIVLSFTTFNLLEWPTLVYADNYIRLFLDDEIFLIAVKNTLMFAIITGPASYLLSLFFAWFINELRPKIRAVVTLLFYAPSISGNVYLIWTIIFSSDQYGYANALLMKFNIIQKPILWFQDEKYIFTLVVLVALWTSLGTSFLTFIAGFQVVDKSLYEAGAVDGVKNRWQELWFITLPTMRPQMMLGAILAITQSFGFGAVITALAMSGLPTQRFTFEGFLSTSNKSRKEHLETLRHEHRTIVLYEAPHKLAETLGDLYDVLGDRDIALGRELTKLHEEIVRTSIGAALEKYRAERPRGEFVLVIRGAPVEKGPRLPLEDALALVEEYRAGGMKLKEAAKRAAAETGQSRNDLYHAALVREKETGAEE